MKMSRELSKKIEALKKLKEGNEGDYEEAEKILRRIRIEDPTDIDVIISLASIYLKKENPQKALALLELEEDRFTDSPIFYKNLSAIHRILNNKEKAFEAIKKAISLDPNNPYWRAALGFTYWAFRDTEKAIEETREALKYVLTKENEVTLDEIRIKNNLAYYYAELGTNEDEAKNYANFTYTHKDKAGELKGWCTDTYAFVNMKFAKNKDEIKEAISLFYQAVDEGHPFDTIIKNHIKEASDKLEKLLEIQSDIPKG